MIDSESARGTVHCPSANFRYFRDLYSSKQRKRIHFLDHYWQDTADQVARAVEHDDPIARGSAYKLHRLAVGRLLAATLLGPSTKTSTVRPKNG